MDKAKDSLTTKEWQQIAEIADNLKSDQNHEAKSLLQSWLTQQSRQKGDNWDRLKAQLKRTEKVFFLWTEDLPTSNLPQQVQKMPTSHGLAKLICACLGVSWRKLNQGGG